MLEYSSLTPVKDFPDIKGFALNNLKYIRWFYLFHEKSQQTVEH